MNIKKIKLIGIEKELKEIIYINLWAIQRCAEEANKDNFKFFDKSMDKIDCIAMDCQSLMLELKKIRQEMEK